MNRFIRYHADLDAIVYATGFDAMTKALTGVDIRGWDGMSLKETLSGSPYVSGSRIPEQSWIWLSASRINAFAAAGIENLE
jgi:hypothetical protein